MGGRHGGKRQDETGSGRRVTEDKCGLRDGLGDTGGNFGGGRFRTGAGPRFGCEKSFPLFLLGSRKDPIISDSWS